MPINWVTFTINLFLWLLTNYECSSWYQTVFQKLRTMNHRTTSFNFKQLFKVQLIALTKSWATYHNQSVPVTFNKFYMFLSESNNKHFVIFEIFEEQMLILCKLLILCCQNLFLQMYERCLNSETSFHFIENQLITEFWKIVKAVIKWTDWK